MASVTISELRKAFGALEVLHGINLDISDEEFVVLVGPSGCGKSTLLRLVAGLETVTSGDIMIGDESVTEMPPKHRDIAMVFQNYALYPHMKVADNIAFGLKLQGMDKAAIKDRVQRAAEMLDLTGYLDRLPKQLSGGQRQRVAMGRAIVRNPKAFLFDEPLSNLDAKLRVQMRAEIKALQQRIRTTTVYVTHDQVEAMTMADRVVIMHEGAIEQVGPPLEVYDHPINLTVAGFIGSPAMNFLQGRLMRSNGADSVELLGSTLAPIASNTSGRDGNDIIYGIRPEHIELGSGNDGIPARVIVTEPTGWETLVFAEIGEQQVRALFKERHNFRPGETIHLKPDLDRVHLFVPETGQRI